MFGASAPFVPGHGQFDQPDLSRVRFLLGTACPAPSLLAMFGRMWRDPAQGRVAPRESGAGHRER